MEANVALEIMGDLLPSNRTLYWIQGSEDTTSQICASSVLLELLVVNDHQDLLFLISIANPLWSDTHRYNTNELLGL